VSLQVLLAGILLLGSFQNNLGNRAIVCDERLSALRRHPDIRAPIVRRLRRGRIVTIIGPARGNSEQGIFVPVAVTRRTKGWILLPAVARGGRSTDAQRILELIAESTDDFISARLARICADEFAGTPAARAALLLLGEAAERSAERLTRTISRRSATSNVSDGVSHRVIWLSDPALDRYNRIRILFELNPGGQRLVYDGGAYRELLRRYPQSAEAMVARERLASLSVEGAHRIER
jgi:hypothetical protein